MSSKGHPKPTSEGDRTPESRKPMLACRNHIRTTICLMETAENPTSTGRTSVADLFANATPILDDYEFDGTVLAARP
mgnify:CR=1 FL=1